MKLPKFIIIEGFWRVGKTKMADYLAKNFNYILINEPNHLTHKVRNNISQWYLKEHLKGLKVAIKQFNLGKSIIMERSIISNIAFAYAKNNRVPFNLIKHINTIKQLNSFIIIFAHADEVYIKNSLSTIKDHSVKKLFLKSNKFYRNYLYFYKKLLPPLIDNKILFVKINKGNKFDDFSNITDYIKNKISKKDGNKKREFCASSVLFYKNKFLLLYDNNCKHYVLSQGHQRKKEKLSLTALREAREETGYQNLKLIKKLKQYQYHFKKQETIIYKNVQPFLIEILNNSKDKKSLLTHEDYSNSFFSFQKAIKKLRWPQDKKLLKFSKNLLEKRRYHFK